MKYIYRIVPMSVENLNHIYDVYFVNCRYSTTRPYKLTQYIQKDLYFIKTGKLNDIWLFEDQYSNNDMGAFHPTNIGEFSNILHIFNSRTDYHAIYMGANKLAEIHFNYIHYFIDGLFS